MSIIGEKMISDISKTIKQNKKSFFTISIFLLIVFSLLAIFTPYTLDDWAWGDQIGVERLQTFFAGYNGRYLGNLLILLISNSRFALVLLMTISYCIACIIPCLYSENIKAHSYLLSAVLFFLLPKAIYAQVVSWASGYSNYMPPVLLLAIYFIIIKNIFNEEKTEYSKITPVITFVIGLAGALFMENVTLSNIAIGALIILFVLIKERKVYLTHFAFLIGAIAGGVIMFSNSAYRIIGNGEDGYRSFASEKGIITTVYEHLNLTFSHLFFWNIYFCIIVSAVFFAICMLFIKTCKDRKAAFFTKVIISENLFALSIILIKYRYFSWQIRSEKFTNVLLWGIVGLYCLSILAGVILCVKSKATKQKLLLLFATFVTLIIPLLVVNPITARCYYPSYFIMTMIVLEMFNYVISLIDVNENTKKAISMALSAALCAFCVFFISIFSYIHSYDNMRSEYIEKQNSNNEKIVYVTKLPYDDYLWSSSPQNKLWVDRFKIYYKINPDSEMEYIDYKDYKKFAEKYDKKQLNK